MKSDLFLGIDTSNYTTSVAVVNGEGEILANSKRLLTVKEGACGLRQSDALFLHTVNLPDILSSVKEHLPISPSAIGVSSTPRRAEGSYMPCFLAGVSAANAASLASGAPLYSFSHQCGHLMAAIVSSERYDVLEKTFCAFHVSGGTTEILTVDFRGNGFDARLVGGTRDLNAGQVIDRIGVMLGLAFPAGPMLEKLALQNEKEIPKRKFSIDGTYTNLSGLENMARKLYEESGDKALTAAFTLRFIADTLDKLTENYFAKFGEMPVIYAGGVMSNALIQKQLSLKYDAGFAVPQLSSDNAVGIAMLAKHRFYHTEG